MANGARISAEKLWGASTALASTASLTSGVIDLRTIVGDALALLVIIGGSGPEINVSFTVARDKDGTYYVPYNTAGSSLGSIVNALTATRWIQFTPALAKFIKITAAGTASNGANTTIEVYLIRQDQ